MTKDITRWLFRVPAGAAAAGLAAVLAACGTAPAGPTAASGSAASASPSGGASQSAPPGYQRVGGTAQGVSVAVPSSWTPVDLAAIPQGQLQSGLKSFGLTVTPALLQALQTLQTQKAFIAIDKQAGAGASQFSTNVNGRCAPSGTKLDGKAAVPVLSQQAEPSLASLSPHNFKLADVTLGGVQGIRLSYTLASPTKGTVAFAELIALPKPGTACFVTLTAQGSVPASLLSTLISSMQFP